MIRALAIAVAGLLVIAAALAFAWQGARAEAAAAEQALATFRAEVAAASQAERARQVMNQLMTSAAATAAKTRADQIEVLLADTTRNYQERLHALAKNQPADPAARIPDGVVRLLNEAGGHRAEAGAD